VLAVRKGRESANAEPGMSRDNVSWQWIPMYGDKPGATAIIRF